MKKHNVIIFEPFPRPSIWRQWWKVVIFQWEHDDDFAWKIHDFWAILMFIHIPETCFFFIFFFLIFSDVKVVRDDSGLYLTHSDFGPIFFVKKCVFFCSWKNLETQIYRRMRVFFVIFCVFVWKKWKSWKIRPRGTLQRWGIKIGGSGGGWKSRSTGVDGCSNGVTVGGIALVVFYYSIIYRDCRLSIPDISLWRHFNFSLVIVFFYIMTIIITIL